MTATNKSPLTLSPDLVALLERAQRGDHDALPALRMAFDHHPELWREAGDLARQAEAFLVRLAAGDNLVIQEAVTRQLHQMRQELVEPSDGKLQHLLVDRVVLCWLELHHLDLLLTQLRERFPKPAQVDALERQRDHAQRRYLAAIRSLASVRKLLRRAPSRLASARPATLAGTNVPSPVRHRAKHRLPATSL